MAPVSPMALDRRLVLAVFMCAFFGNACSPSPPGSGPSAALGWDCPTLACDTLEASAQCTSGVCTNAGEGANRLVVVRLPTNSNKAPGAVLLANPSVSASCPDCISLPEFYATEHALVVARDVAKSFGWPVTGDVSVPCDVTLEPLVLGKYTLSSLLPSPISPVYAEGVHAASASLTWQNPSGAAAAETARALLFLGKYQRKFIPRFPYDEVLPPFADTAEVPGVHALGISSVTLETLEVPLIDLPAKPTAGPWRLYLADAQGTRRSSVARGTKFAGPVVFRVRRDAAYPANSLDLIVIPGNESVTSPRLVVPTPAALRRVAYPVLPRTSLLTIRVSLPSGAPASGASVSVLSSSLRQSLLDPDSVFAEYAYGQGEVRADADGVASVRVPYGVLAVVARAKSNAQLSVAKTLDFAVTVPTLAIALTTSARRVVGGTCAFVGGLSLGAGAQVEARALGADVGPPSFRRISSTTAEDGSFELQLPDGAFSFWFHPPQGSPLYELSLGEDKSSALLLASLDCRLRAPVRRSLTILDANPQRGAPIGAALVETFGLRGESSPVWLGESVSHSDGRAVVYEAP